MRLKDNGKIWILILFILLLFVAAFQFNKYVNIERSDYDITFRQVYGDINIRKDRENLLSLAFIVKNTNSKFDDYLSQQRLVNNISFNTGKIKVSQFSIVESLNYNNSSYYFLNLRLVPTDDFNDICEINTISLGEDTYNIGKLTLKLVSNDTGDLKIESVKAFSPSMEISDFLASIKNTNPYQELQILDVYTGQMANLNPEVTLESASKGNLERYKGATIAPNETIDVTIRFNKQSNPSDIVYYISPIIQYKDSTGTHNLYFDYYSAGLNIPKSDFISIISE